MKEKINKGNYEEWMLDFIEGNLDAAGEEEVRRFLDMNPELKKELEDIRDAVLVPEEELFFDKKSSLKRNDKNFGDLTRNEYLFIAKTENSLTSMEKDEYALLLRTDPGAMKEQHLFDKTVLKADVGVRYEEKNRIRRVVLVPFFNREMFGRAAAVVILILLFGVSWFTFMKGSFKPGRDIAEVHEKVISVPDAGAVIISDAVAGKENIVTVADKKDNNEIPPAVIVSEKPKSVSGTVHRQDAPGFAMLTPKGVNDVLKPVKINGYEVAVDQIMPLYISYLRNMDEEPSVNPVANKDENSADNGLLAGGVKVLNKLTGNFLNFRKKYDESGDVIAYTIAIPNIRIDHKMRREQNTNAPEHQ